MAASLPLLYQEIISLLTLTSTKESFRQVAKSIRLLLLSFRVILRKETRKGLPLRRSLSLLSDLFAFYQVGFQFAELLVTQKQSSSFEEAIPT